MVVQDQQSALPLGMRDGHRGECDIPEDVKSRSLRDPERPGPGGRGRLTVVSQSGTSAEAPLRRTSLSESAGAPAAQVRELLVPSRCWC